MLGYGIKETTATTGTGTLTLSAVTGFPRFSDAFVVGELVEYSLLNSSGEPIESGMGTIGASNTLERSRVTVTYSSGVYNDVNPTAVSLTGTTTVICTVVPSVTATVMPGINSTQTYSGVAAQRVLMDARLNFSATGSITLAANQLYMQPFYLSTECVATGIALRIVTGVSAKLLRAGLYKLDNNSSPKTLVDETAALSVATSGVNLTGSFTSNHRLVPGWYCIAFVSDGSPAVGSVTGHLLMNPTGILSTNSVLSPTSYNYGSHTFGPLPATPPTAVTAGSTQHPAVGLTIL